MTRIRTNKLALLSVFLLTLLIGVAQFASAQQGPGGPRPGGPGQGERDPLGGLKRALNDAGAPALSSTQEEQLKTLVTNFREAQKDREPDEALQAAHKAYEEAVVAGNTAAAQAAAATIANGIAAHMQARLQAQAELSTQALAILKTNQEQIDKLVAKFGTTGLFRIVSSLAGGPGFGGPGFGGPGGRERMHEGPGAGPGGGGFAPRVSSPRNVNRQG